MGSDARNHQEYGDCWYFQAEVPQDSSGTEVSSFVWSGLVFREFTFWDSTGRESPTTSEFFDFCGQGLRRYSSLESVLQISGYPRLPVPPGARQRVIRPRSDYWAWATRRDRWVEFREKSHSQMEVSLNASSSPPGLVCDIYIGHQKALHGHLDPWASSWAQLGKSTNRLALVTAADVLESVDFGRQATHTTRGGAPVTRSVSQDLDQLPAKFRPSLVYAWADEVVLRTRKIFRNRRKETPKFRRIVLKHVGRVLQALKIMVNSR